MCRTIFSTLFYSLSIVLLFFRNSPNRASGLLFIFRSRKYGQELMAAHERLIRVTPIFQMMGYAYFLGACEAQY